jgi:hypothetical protein
LSDRGGPCRRRQPDRRSLSKVSVADDIFADCRSPGKTGCPFNTAGAIAGGDRVECSVTAVANAFIAVTSQTAERVYGALLKPVRVMTKLKVSDGSRLAWFPQETMIFNWARLHRETEVDISCEVESLHSSGLCSVVGDHGEQTVRAES